MTFNDIITLLLDQMTQVNGGGCRNFLKSAFNCFQMTFNDIITLLLDQI